MSKAVPGRARVELVRYSLAKPREWKQTLQTPVQASTKPNPPTGESATGNVSTVNHTISPAVGKGVWGGGFFTTLYAEFLTLLLQIWEGFPPLETLTKRKIPRY